MSWKDAIRKGTDRLPAEDVLILGPHGTGKSTFAIRSPDPIIICADPHEAADIPDGVPNITPIIWDDPDGAPFDISAPSLLGLLRHLATDEHDFKSVAVDTLTSAQTLCERAVCEKHSVSIVGDIPWNKGPSHLADAWRPFVALMEAINKRGIHTIRTAHVETKRYKNPEGQDWDQFVAQMDPGLAKISAQSASNVLFSLPEMHAIKIGDKKTLDAKTVGGGTGKFVLRTTYSATVAGKERLFLPDEMEVSWAAFQIAAQEGRKIRSQLERALRAMSLKHQAAAEKYLCENRYSRDSALAIIAQAAKSNGKSTTQAPVAAATTATSTSTTTTETQAS